MAIAEPASSASDGVFLIHKSDRYKSQALCPEQPCAPLSRRTHAYADPTWAQSQLKGAWKGGITQSEVAARVVRRPNEPDPALAGLTICIYLLNRKPRTRRWARLPGCQGPLLVLVCHQVCHGIGRTGCSHIDELLHSLHWMRWRPCSHLYEQRIVRLTVGRQARALRGDSPLRLHGRG